MKENEVYVLAKEVLTDEGQAIESWVIAGVTREAMIARVWCYGYGHSAYLAEITGELVPAGIQAVEY